MALPEGIPELTLGWAVLEWCSKWLVNPDSDGGEKGGQWIFKPDQARFILWFYAVDENGNWIYRRAYRERAKGTGKSPMVAAMACAEFIGPVIFSHFDPKVRGGCVGKERSESLIWLAAISQDGTNHTYQYIMAMLESPVQQAYDLHVGLTKIFVRGRAKGKLIRQITASPKSWEGPKPHFAICEETQNWTPGENGPKLMEVIHRGLTKTDGRRVEVTNAPEPGQGTVAEMTHDMQREVEEGLREPDSGLLFDTFMIHVDDIYDKEQAMPALAIMYKDAPWMRLERVFADICDPSQSEVSGRRFFFNEIVPPNAMWIKEGAWDAALDRDLRLKKSDKIALGFRSHKNCAAIVATRLEDSAVFLLKLWERPLGEDAPRDWTVPYYEIDLEMRKILKAHNVWYVIASPENYADTIGRWAVEFETDTCTFEEQWMSRNKQKYADCEDLFSAALHDKRLHHNGDEDLKRHVMNCFAEEVPQGKILRTETPHSHRYIVAAEAALLSMRAAQEAITDGALQERRSRVIYSF